MDSKTLWDTVLIQIELEVSKATYTAWFKDTFISKIDSGTVYLAVPNTFVREWLQNKFHKVILQNLRNSLEGVRAVEYIIAQSNKKKEDYVTEIPAQTKELPLNAFLINPEDNLNPRYTFETFVVGPFNELAYAASQAILKKPVAYNPLFFHGNTGLGKTHLMQSIGNHIKQHHKDKRIHYVTSERFTIDYINSVQSNKVHNFKEKYRKYDVFIMDDIQFLSNKEKTQEELFHLFNHMYDANKQIIFSSDQHPNYLQNLEDRLKSRFMAGMIIDISPLDTESKIAILQTKAKMNNFNLEPEIAYYIASVVHGSIRELEGTLNAVICQAQLKGKDVTLADVKQITKDSTKPQKSISVKDVVKAVSAFYNIEEESIYNKTRRQEVVKPRQLTMYILREDYNISFPSIGQKLGNRDHTTVMHSCEKIRNELKNNPDLTSELNQIRSLI
ncbi:MAG TPA: chromosomal replication initiator protein DnaA [Candidatus Paceibacterota bacterium]